MIILVDKIYRKIAFILITNAIIFFSKKCYFFCKWIYFSFWLLTVRLLLCKGRFSACFIFFLFIFFFFQHDNAECSYYMLYIIFVITPFAEWYRIWVFHLSLVYVSIQFIYEFSFTENYE